MLSPLLTRELRLLHRTIARNAPTITTYRSDARLGSAVEIKRRQERAIVPFDSGRSVRGAVGRFR